MPLLVPSSSLMIIPPLVTCSPKSISDTNTLLRMGRRISFNSWSYFVTPTHLINVHYSPLFEKFPSASSIHSSWTFCCAFVWPARLVVLVGCSTSTAVLRLLQRWDAFLLVQILLGSTLSS